MPTLDWSQCPAVERVTGRGSGACVFKDTRMPVANVFENLEDGSDIEEIVEQFHGTCVSRFKRFSNLRPGSFDAPPIPVGAAVPTDAHSL